MLMTYIMLVIRRVVDIYSFLLIAYALLSWFPNAYDTWLGRLLTNIVEPVLKPFRRLNLQFAGLDFTIIVVLILLNVLERILVNLILL